MILRIYSLYKTGKTIFSKLLKPIYEDLRKDAYADETDKRTINRKRKKKTSNAVNQKSERSHQRKANS